MLKEMRDQPREASESVATPAPLCLQLRSWSDSANLDVLRTFAVTCVVARHVIGNLGVNGNRFFQPQALGIFGVLLFFVHTCLVLMASLGRHEGDGSRLGVYFWPFITRRVFRIYPLSIAAVLIAAIVVNASASTIWPNLLLVQHIVKVPSIPPPLWSLPYELAMYLALPAIFLWTRRSGPRPILVAWVVFMTLAICQKYVSSIPEMLQYVPAFLPGVLAFLLRRRERWPAWLLPATLIVGLIVDMALYAKFGGQALVGAPICLGAGLLLPNLVEVKSTWVRLSARTIAKYSYGIYLFHSIALTTFASEGGVPARLPILHGWTAIVIALIATAVASVVSYHLLEQPMIRLGTNVSRRLRNHLATRRKKPLPA